ncbi:hypothetical protein [Antribacter gilvus]|uniref:hypothetical protein n=1 Tax=Antribacter gilvus TaxID=2304675 RepID=UPI000F77400E|nr:hypothetical protein [Antribacter gilvus]
MDADQVPEDILETARAALLQGGPAYGAELRPDGTEDPSMAAWVEGWHDAWAHLPDVLAAVWPLIAAQVLQEATAALKVAYKEPPTTVLTEPQRAGWQIGMARAHRIVRDQSRAAALRSPDADGGGERG